MRGFGEATLTSDQVMAAYPWPAQGRWVRAMMVTTLDGGAAGPDGLSGSISSAADRLVFDSVRRNADVVLVGAGTIRAERYQPMMAKPADREARRAAGQLEAPVVAIISGSLNLDWNDRLFTESTHRPVVVTTEGAPDLAKARKHADVIALPGERVSIAAAVSALEGRGLRRIVCEGGPLLLNEAVAAGMVDEADITVSPMFSGTALSPATPALDPVRYSLEHVLSEDDFVMLRYLRRDAR